MILNKKTLDKLRELLNEETEYRSGPQLVKFFNGLGFNDQYGQGFPSRWLYTDERLSKINGSPEIDKCIKNIFAPINFIGRYQELDKYIEDFNQYLAYDGWQVIRDGKEIHFTKAGEISFTDTDEVLDENDFINQEFKEVQLEELNLDGVVTETLKKRLEEIKKCMSAKAALATIFLAGSTLEGILLGIALKYPKKFNTSFSAPKDNTGKPKKFQSWSLNDLINAAHEQGYLKEDVKKFSHSLREFRNYIHPYEQMSSRFDPDEHTAKISWQVLKAAIYQLTGIS